MWPQTALAANKFAPEKFLSAVAKNELLLAKCEQRPKFIFPTRGGKSHHSLFTSVKKSILLKNLTRKAF